MTNCTNNATHFLAGHRERIVSEHTFQSLRHIEDTQPNIITHRAHQRRTTQGGTLPHLIAAAVFKPMISMGGGSLVTFLSKMLKSPSSDVAAFYVILERNERALFM